LSSSINDGMPLDISAILSRYTLPQW